MIEGRSEKQRILPVRSDELWERAGRAARGADTARDPEDHRQHAEVHTLSGTHFAAAIGGHRVHDSKTPVVTRRERLMVIAVGLRVADHLIPRCCYPETFHVEASTSSYRFRLLASWP